MNKWGFLEKRYNDWLMDEVFCSLEIFTKDLKFNAWLEKRFPNEDGFMRLVLHPEEVDKHERRRELSCKISEIWSSKVPEDYREYIRRKAKNKDITYADVHRQLCQEEAI